jgi:hypothetical protein
LFIRHGRDQPFKVTTGLKGRPVDGWGGTRVFALSMTIASGNDAAPARLTAAALTAMAPAPLKKSRREVIVLSLNR